ncbi:MAG: FAD:protein FMN transferase [Fretibacterium sp.]|nr:FAD:protein FMN transferase [Fretibacterium sp.]
MKKTGRRCAAGLAALTLLIVLAAGRHILEGQGGFFPLTSHQEQETTISREGFSMNTLISISATGREEQAQAALDDSLALIRHLDEELSLYRKESTLSGINARAGGEALAVSPDVFTAVAGAREMCRLTEGVFNPLIGPVTKLWKINRNPDDPETFTLPKQASLDAALVLTDPAGLELSPAGDGGGTVRLARRGAMLDLGGIAKGYASTEIVKLLHARGMTSALVNLGGNVHVLGTKGGTPWNIGIRNPLTGDLGAALPPELHSLAKTPVALVLAAEDPERRGLALITSGGYERYRIVNGVRYSHFFDPRTGMPVQNDLLSATVVSPDGAMADALATTFMIMGSERAMEFIQSSAHPDLGAVLIRRSPEKGFEILATENLRGSVRRSLTEVRYF